MMEGLYAGIDLGSSAIKAVLVDSEETVRKRFLRDTSLDLEQDIQRLMHDIDKYCSTDKKLVDMVSTGYGRNNVPRARISKPEIICHARGVYQQIQQACTIIDIGGQDNKVIHLEADGRVESFRMNTKCAAGTGSFLEEIANKAKLPLDQLNALAENSESELSINSFCTVFAMTEVLKRIVGGERLEDIIRGIFNSVADRVREMCGNVTGQLVLTGGVVAKNPLLPDMIAKALKKDLIVCEHARYTGALGAALICRNSTVGDAGK